MVTIIGRFLCYALARQRPGLPCVKGAVSEADWGIALPQHRYTHKLHRNFCRHRCWEYGWLSDHIPPEKRCGLHLFWCFYPHSVENRPTQWQALLMRNRSQRYIFPTPFVWKNGQGRTAENHTIGAVLPWSFLFAAVLPKEPTAYCALAAWQSLRHGLRRATSLYTREALVLRKIADRTVHRKVYGSALFISSTNCDL